MRHVSHLDTAISTAKAAATSPSPSPPAVAQPRSPWHSPVPYLFGVRMKVMTREILKMEMKRKGKPENKVFEEKFLVIMAGNERPTFLATPVCSKASSFVAKIGNEEEEEKTESTPAGHDDKVKNQEMIGDSHDQAATTRENTETTQESQQVQEQN
ncbi:PROTEIN GLUTAMINE DUMPER 2 [Salix koriyanagi]|uniref:PROTEIN GLUTAMINE DUMPER 2 n=1 Tax=Salix koriyanagi TaxID=2511006 RepID=A0A9Q0W1W9_9ROSI|nr:PROTEIN GLUTAMINE DUMPER 2 [Salix koriyanagi]